MLSAAANSVIVVNCGKSALYDSARLVVIVPVARTSAFNTFISASDCIASAPVIACHLAASLATTPVDIPFTELAPGIFGRSSPIYV